MVELRKEGDVFVATMNDGENRFNPTTVAAWNTVLDEVEAAAAKPDALCALVTTGTGKFFLKIHIHSQNSILPQNPFSKILPQIPFSKSIVKRRFLFSFCLHKSQLPICSFETQPQKHSALS